MDGVLINTVHNGYLAREKLLNNYGVDLESIPGPQGENHRAASLKNLLASVELHSGIRIDYDEFASLSRERMREDLRTQNKSADQELARLLKELKKHGIPCAIVSSSHRESIDIKLEVLGIREYFSVIITGSDIAEHKPHPAAYLHAAKRLGAPPSDCIAIEDSLTGIESALAAGCKVIEFTQHNTPRESSPHVMASIKSWDELSYARLNDLYLG